MSKENTAMQITLLVTSVLHILSGVFWAGSTFALARTGAGGADQLFRPQMGAALVAVITGGVLWHLLHPSSFGTPEQVLALGALAAVLAAGVQGALCGRALRELARNSEKDAHSKTQVALGHRIAAALLVLTVICMAAARYA
jgi:F0F1-type ATP synthase membrane subunit c/vacuolar-type H+-ATPase subunit K